MVWFPHGPEGKSCPLVTVRNLWPFNLTLFLLSQPLIPELLAWAMCVFLYWFIFPLVTMFVSFYVYFHHFWKSCF
ncbi:hypothetical protein BO79DRAFT_40427 [Aspergillus costaricaensis CBS 115574]|uniref:Uncharacterized protein n=1 Tax=Aspergillus costaricaensis CBS 115574 TaxID=1448317 RepID=A0ACD1I6V4_9EURO|nr:hypothetical protein BO79DRAFT_40427 [Aspergillus costaricaensis CBS 115574]RAK86012.1 hypothetical protein BO79DRAFT_40427 [Aspergillus costaricaensis CBS 115574]